MYRYFKRVIGAGSGDCIYFWKSKGFSDKNITALTTSNYSLNPQLSYFGTKTRMEFKGSCLKQDNYNTYIVYEISNNNSNYPALKICLFCAASLPKKADIDKYKYFGYGIGFDGHRSYSHQSGRNGRNAIIFGVDMSSFTKVDYRKKDILILDLGPT